MPIDVDESWLWCQTDWINLLHTLACVGTRAGGRPGGGSWESLWLGYNSCNPTCLSRFPSFTFCASSGWFTWSESNPRPKADSQWLTHTDGGYTEAQLLLPLHSLNVHLFLVARQAQHLNLMLPLQNYKLFLESSFYPIPPIPCPDSLPVLNCLSHYTCASAFWANPDGVKMSHKTRESHFQEISD